MSVNDPNKVIMTTPNSSAAVETKETPAAPEDPFKGFITKSFEDGKEQTVAAPGEEEVDDAEEGDDDAEQEEHEEDGETGAGDEEEEEPETRQEPKQPPKTKKKASERIAQLVKARNAERTAREAAERRAADAEARLVGKDEKKDLTPPKKEVKSKTTAPSPDDYDFGELDRKYIADLAKFEAKKALADERAAEEADRSKTRQAEQTERLEGEALSLMEKGLEKFGDEFDELVIQGAANKAWALSDTLGQLIGTSAVGADIALHLARDPKEALRVYRLPPMEQAAYFGRMEAKFSSGDVKPKKQVQAPKAPPPPSTKVRGAGGKFSVSADTNDFAAFEKMASSKH